MEMKRPNLQGLPPDVCAYIEALEAELARRVQPQAAAEPFEPSEPPTTRNVIAISTAGLAKRTPRHLYDRQRRGGMGVFDLDVPEDDSPEFLTVADESQNLLMLTSEARAVRLPVTEIVEAPVRGRGQSLAAHLALRPGERLSLVLPEEESTYVALLTARGHVKWYAGHLFGRNLQPGVPFYEAEQFGAPVAACRTSGSGDLLIATRQGYGIRFAARLVPTRGCLGIRLAEGDAPVALCAVDEESGVFLLGADGKGTIRLMAGFRANKSPGAGGKVLFKTDALLGAAVVDEADDILALSRLAKIIRFCAAEVPAKEGVVQGVNCMALRADQVVALSRA